MEASPQAEVEPCQPIASGSSTSQKHPRDCCQSSPKSKTKKARRDSPKAVGKQSRGPDLPPLFALSFPSDSTSPTAPPPVFPSIPPLSSVVSIAGSGCCCGFRCTCPGCVEHRGADHAAKDHKDCPDQCGTCVDYDGGIELPSLSAQTGSSSAVDKTPSFIDAFFARAAATVPLPPSQRVTGVALDPTNVVVYPTSLFSGENKNMEERGAAFGLIRLPKLECCAGKCGCPEGSCGCGTSCDGCGEKHDGGSDSCCSSSAPTNVALTSPMQNADAMSSVAVLAPLPASGRSCCG